MTQTLRPLPMRPALRLALVLVFVLAALAAMPAAQAQSDDAALLRCSQSADNATRLSCYDALAAQVRQRTAAARPAASAADKVAEFGQPPKPSAGDIEVMESRIAGHFEGWRPGQRITLVNGQVWQISDDSSAFGNAQSPVVRIRRAALGSFMMEVDGLTRSPRVKRVQ